MEKKILLFSGAISCKSILENPKRQCERLYVDKTRRSKDFSYIISLAKRRNVPVTFMDKEQLKEKLGIGAGGMGLEAEILPIPPLNTFEKTEGLSAYISGLEDPYNLGSVIRTLYAAGANLLVLPRRDWSQSEAVIVKASAGCFDKLPIAWIESEQELIDYKTRFAIPLVSACRKDASDLFETSMAPTSMIVIGGAMRGISALLLEASDQRVFIPYGRNFRNSLDTPSAAAVMAFCYTRQFGLDQTEGE